MAATSVAQMFQRGIDLFNQARFFEAHEAWEQSWLRSRGEEKIFYQGLIQAAAAILHVQRGNPAGARNLWKKAGGKLAILPADYMSIDLEQLRSRLAEFFNRALSGNEAASNPPPRIRRL
jgi:predicted metal-dependent hydrolase